MKRDLERIEIPGEHEARKRAWAVVREREPARPPVPFLRPLVVLATVAALVAAAFSPPGRAVVDSVRDALGAKDAADALFALPAPGRVLVSSDAGLWVVTADGSKRFLGDYRDGAWSPFGRFVAGTRDSELVALEPDGDVRWKLSRPNVRFPIWSGTATNTRIASLAGGRLRVVGGDGRGDVEVRGAGAPRPVRPAWRPTRMFELTYVGAHGRVRTFLPESPALSIAFPFGEARRLAWSPNGARLVVIGRNRYLDVSRSGTRGFVTARRLRGITDAAFAPDGRLAITRTVDGQSELRIDDSVKFSGTGTFGDVTWSPDGRWVLVTWREADQWLFVRASGQRRARAVANVSRQFDSRTPPRIRGWCCR